MSSGIIAIIIGIIILSVIIYVINYNKQICNFLYSNKILKKLIKLCEIFIIIIGIIFLINYTAKTIIKISNNLKDRERMKEYEEIANTSDQIVMKQEKIYKKIVEEINENQNYSNPYIPEGFKYVEGKFDTGFVISDQNNNEYVWVPCNNVENDNIPMLEKTNFAKSFDYISKDQCYEEKNSEEFIKSALVNGGFYISRYELGIENENVVSKKNVEVYMNSNKNEIQNKIKNTYENIEMEIINGYAYDTTLNWIFNTNNIKQVNSRTIENEKILTGKIKYNNIYDIIDDIYEMSSEIYYDNYVIRGFNYTENKIEKDTRQCVQKNEENLNEISFRTILYK